VLRAGVGEEGALSESRIIELDAEWDLLESPEPQRTRAMTRMRGLAAAVIVALCLGTLGAGAKAPVPPLTLLGLVKRPNSGAPLQTTDMRLAGGMLLAQTGGALVAIDPTGRQRWRARFDMGRDSYLNYWMWQGNLIVERMELVGYGDGEYAGLSTTTSIALDPVTGAERWRAEGSLQAAGDVIIVDDGAHPRRVYRSLPSDLLWTMPATLAWEVNVARNAVYAVTPDGTFAEYDLHTGALRASGKVDVPVVADGKTSPVGRYPDALSLQVFEDRLVLRAQRFGEFGPMPAVTLVYDRMTLQPIPSARDQFEAVLECGPVLCAMSGEQMSILDKEEFVELWRPQPGEYPYWVGSHLMISGHSSVDASKVVDPRTGRVLLQLDGWVPIGLHDRPTDASPLWLTRSVAPNYTRVAVLQGSAPRVVGSVPFELTNCELEGDLLACGVADGRVGVWRVNLSLGTPGSSPAETP
jgi:hypothetical protein